MTDLREWMVSVIRTSIVPPVAGFVLTVLASHNIRVIKEEWVFGAVTIILSGIWYLLFRALELASKNPKVVRIAGIFLGYIRPEVKVAPVEVQAGNIRWGLFTREKKDSGYGAIDLLIFVIVLVVIVWLIRAVLV